MHSKALFRPERLYEEVATGVSENTNRKTGNRRTRERSKGIVSPLRLRDEASRFSCPLVVAASFERSGKRSRRPRICKAALLDGTTPNVAIAFNARRLPAEGAVGKRLSPS